MLLLMIFLSLFLLSLFLLLIPIYINIKVDSLESININFYAIFKIFKYNLNYDFKDKFSFIDEVNETKNDENNSYKAEFDKLLNNICKLNNYKPIIYYIFDKIKVNRIIWHTQIGLQDAALTAYITGLLWSIKSIITSFLSTRTYTKNIDIDILPKYNNKEFEIYFNCIIRIKLVNIIIAGIKKSKIIKKGCVLGVRSSN